MTAIMNRIHFRSVSHTDITRSNAGKTKTRRDYKSRAYPYQTVKNDQTCGNANR